MASEPMVRACGCEVRLAGDLAGFEAELGVREEQKGVAVVSVVLSSPRPAGPPRVALEWSLPVADVQGSWHANIGRDRGLSPDWGGGGLCRATSGAPVRCLYNLSDRNRLTFACSEALQATRLTAGVREETAHFDCRVELLAEPGPPVDRYEVQIRLDRRPVPYWRALADVSDWWAGMDASRPAPVPPTARLPMYSTWYSFHQRLDVDEVVRQCALAKQLGCEAVIVDDGWQTTDSARGYAYCGDWRPERIEDMAGFVRRVHDVGMKLLLWYSVPHVGRHSEAYGRLADKCLYEIDSHGAAIVDPRFPEVREYLIGTYERAIRQWDVDGFKLDFVDCFRPTAATPAKTDGDGRDHASVAAGADRLLSDVIDRLRRIRPDVMIEFRQSYVGPVMRKYGHMFRAGDCPNDAVTNRVRTLDIRLLCGATAAHADMLMWHGEDPVESAALQVLSILFAVPQISVLLDRLPAAHLEMLRFWLGFWREHRDVLLDGRLEPLHPVSLYPIVRASTASKRVLAVYEDAVADAGDDVPEELLIVNATRARRVVIELPEGIGPRAMQTFDTRGRQVAEDAVELGAGVHSIGVPPAGLVALRR